MPRRCTGIVARFKGLSKVQAQCLLAAAAQNMKKIARLLAQLFGPIPSCLRQ